MSREFKNSLGGIQMSEGDARRSEIFTAPLLDSTVLPPTLKYKDIDEEFLRWVKEDLSISFEGKELPTIALYSNQRFSEYMQTWQDVDEKKNILINFKTVSRENNPKQGSLIGDTRNIPGERYYTIQRINAVDNNGRPYFVDYKMKQPYCVDLIYKISVVTNKYLLLNDFNEMLNNKFKSIQCYIKPNGYYLPMKLEGIDDESEYNIDDRTYYSQSFNILVQGYIIDEESYKIEENSVVRLMGIETDMQNSSENTYTDIEEEEISGKTIYYVNSFFGVNDKKTKFTIDTDMILCSAVTDNVSSYKISINDTDCENIEGKELKNGDKISIRGIKRKLNKISKLQLIGKSK